MTDQKIKDAVYRSVCAVMSGHPSGTGGCLYWAGSLVRHARLYNLRVVLQAGTLMWPRIRPEQDDGVCNTHFSYVWEPESPLTKQRLEADLMPEMHVWAGNPDTGEIIDFTTGYLVEQCLKSAGMDWPGDPPPKYLWDATLPEGVIYRPDRAATMLAYTFLRRSSLL